jgi:hypothetical protein
LRDLVPPDLDAIDAAWVEEALARGGVEAPRVARLRVEPIDASNSSGARLHLQGVAGGTSLPPALFLKLCPRGHEFLGASEIAYYTRDYAGLKNAPIVQCLAAIGPRGVAAGESLGAGYALLLADLTASHTDNKRIRPTGPHARRLGHALGTLHAHRWGAEADPDGPHDLDAEFDRYLAHTARGLGPVLGALGEALDATDRDRLARVFDEDVARMQERARAGTGVALLHGDPNPTNVLKARDTDDARPPLYLIDRQPFAWSLRLWLGAIDLVKASVPFWTREERRLHERALLEGYHAALLEGGVADFPWFRLVADWRACLCHAAVVGVEWGADVKTLESMRWLWERQVDRALGALADWDDA